ncbi:hypothetical protein D9754_01595 [Planomicrobium sp. Y74]|nr:hypothetical protein D9754_01595 [Planomicrobium sp. Y74]
MIYGLHFGDSQPYISADRWRTKWTSGILRYTNAAVAHFDNDKSMALKQKEEKKLNFPLLFLLLC